MTAAQQWQLPDDSIIERQATHNHSKKPTADVPRRDGPARKRIRTETVPHNEGSDLSNTKAESEEDVDFVHGLQNFVTSPLNFPLVMEGNDILKELSDFYEVQERCGLTIQESLA
ncbi:hypothetical protein ACJMK2_020405 [Sinanodonta woodiana]|uniref:Uncharacterized protein n=1 Tax=Sinanodonta woodiana TaxID=1069815 RepID=A0ABD3U013_SINWO